MARARKSAVLAVAAVAFLSLPAAAFAVFPGPNGEIAFVSGRGAGGDASADVYILSKPGGTVTPLTSAAGQHRHPNWSPDRSEIVYALWNGATDEDLWVHNVANGGRTRLESSGTVREDRPAWSPDGTKIAYESEVSDGSGQQDILIANANGSGTPVNLTQTPGETEGKPVWSPDGETIFYSRFSPGDDADIYSEPSDNSVLLNPPTVLATTNNEFQPALSPDGSELCYTRGATGAFVTNDTADVYKVSSTGTGPITNIGDNGAVGEYNCAWSPDGTKIAFVRGIFSNGALVMKNSDDTGTIDPVVDDAAGVFDGNPDWTFNPPPACIDVSREVATNGRVTVPLACSDPDDEELTYSIVTGPASGELGPINQGAATVEYVPDGGFFGSDAFTFKANDGTSDSNTATASITINAPLCEGTTATIAGTGGDDTITGTGGSDVIAAFAGNDTVNAGAGNDLVCGEDGNDAIKGGAGKDRLYGAEGNDKLKGNGGKDKLFGEDGKDKLKGGGGKDRCVGGAGKDKAKSDCEKRKSI